MHSLLVLHGPNLNLLGKREPDIYGKLSLDDINNRLLQSAEKIGFELKIFQSNCEGELINALHDAQNWAAGVIFNPGGYTHTSVAIRDAIAAIRIPVIEVHLSNIDSREEFRRISLTAPVCRGSIAGFGWLSYWLALQAFSTELLE